MRFSAVSIGTFDGFHKGHKYLIDKLNLIAEKYDLRSILVALSNPVRPVSGLLTDIEEKKRILKGVNVDKVIILPVTDKIINQTAADFLEKFICDKLNVKYLVIGHDFAFGHKRHGNVEWLRKIGAQKGFNVISVHHKCHKNEIISSSRIRTALLMGDVDNANNMLGRFYEFSGIPVKGRGIGKKLQAPTINLKVDDNKILPPGVHIVTVEKGGVIYPGIINIGSRPTFFKKGKIVPEIFLLNFLGKWPRGKVNVYLRKHIRKEKCFKNQDLLKEQIKIDINIAKRYFIKHLI